MARTAALPILTAEPGLTHYFEEIRRFPMLERREEYMLAKRWRDHDAAHKLVTSHLRLVTKIAMGYRGYAAGLRTILVECEMGSGPVMILKITRQDAAQVTLVEDDGVIQAFATNRTDEALDIWILPG
jgi:hypothetical protein